MKILVACEESQAATIELRKLGHEAYSCDIIEESGGHPEWHIRQDVLPLITGEPCEFTTGDGTVHQLNTKWDMIIAFPPCTHLAVSGAAWFENKRKDGRQRAGIEFFMNIVNSNCDKVAIENPVGIISGTYISKWFPDLQNKYSFPIKPTQIIHPWEYGDSFEKTTCLWTKGLNPLKPTNVVSKGEYKEWVDKKTGKTKRQSLWFFEALSKTKNSQDRAKIRSKTFPGIAKAMADQWAGKIN